MTRSRVLRHRSGAWEGVTPEAYRAGVASPEPVMRHTLLGRDPGDAMAFETRYFEVAPGTATSLERHAHAHAVVVLQGKGEVRLGDVTEPLAPFDVVYVAPWEVHQFRAASDHGMGFLCVVDRDRDHPQRLQESTS